MQFLTHFNFFFHQFGNQNVAHNFFLGNRTSVTCLTWSFAAVHLLLKTWKTVPTQLSTPKCSRMSKNTTKTVQVRTGKMTSKKICTSGEKWHEITFATRSSTSAPQPRLVQEPPAALPGGSCPCPELLFPRSGSRSSHPASPAKKHSWREARATVRVKSAAVKVYWQ